MDPNNRKLPKSPTSSDAAGVGLPRPSPPPLLPLSPPRKEPCDCAQSSPPPQPVPDTTLTPWWMKRAPGSGKVRLGGESEKEGRGTRKREEIKRKGEKTRRGGGRPSGVRRVPQILQLCQTEPPWTTRKRRGQQRRAGSCGWPRPLLLTPRSRSLSPSSPS